MAVLKSTAYGQVRKSVGANNYYRRAGVQIVRSKPTFAPGRQFTQAQLMQQEVMRLAQYIGLQAGLRDIADYMNVNNNRLYNASSRYNRLLKNIMPEIKKLITSTSTPSLGFWYEYAAEITTNMSVGNYPPIPFSMTPRQYSAGVALTFDQTDLSFAGWLETANKKRANSGKFSFQNIGAVGVMWEQLERTTRATVLQPTMIEFDGSPTNKRMQFYFDIGFNPVITNETTFNMVFFIADFFADEEPAIISKPQWCTSTQEVALPRPPIP